VNFDYYKGVYGMGQQVVIVDEGTFFQQMKVRMGHLRADVKALLDAVRSDSAALRKSMMTLRERSEILSFIQGRIKERGGKGGGVEVRVANQKLARKKSASSETGRAAAH
jgi:hypothetical protein